MYYRYRREIKLVLSLALLAGLVYGGLKGWLYYKVAQTMDELSTAAVGFADIRYGGIETELGGVVRVLDLTVQPEGAPVPVSIDQARVTGPDLGFFLWGQREEDASPPRLRVDLSGMAVALDQELFDALEQDAPGGGFACSPGSGTEVSLLRELGLERLAMDAAFAYEYDRDERRLRANFEVDVHQIERIAAELELREIAPGTLAGGGMEGIPSLAGASVDVRVEPEFGKRYLAACAKRRGQDPDTFRETLVAETLAELSRLGMQLGDGLRWALDTYHKEWGDLRIVAEPSEPLNLMALLFAEPGDWQRKLGVRVTVNRIPVTDLSFELRPSSSEELAALLGEAPPRRPLEPQIRYRYVYHDQPVASLVQHVGEDVRLHLANDQPMRAGVLVSVGDGEARVEQRLHGGKMTAHVALRDIRRLEVREVEQIPTK